MALWEGEPAQESSNGSKN